MLQHFLPSVLHYTQHEDVRIIVADNGSTDGSISLLSDAFPSVQRLSFTENYGFAEGYNRAIQAVEAEYVVLLNSDVAVTEAWLTPMLHYLDAHPEVAAVQPKIRKYVQDVDREKDNPSPQFEHAGAAGGMLDYLGYPFCRGRIMDTVENDHGQYDTPMDIFWTSGACMVIRRAVYLREGGLDASFFAHQEEIDLCWRLQSRGYRLVCLPESVVYHLGGGALNYENPRKTYLNFRNNLLMIYKNMPTNRLVWIFSLRFAMDYTAAIVYLLKGKIPHFQAVCKARWDYHRMKKQMRSKRQENMQKTLIPYPPTMLRRSLVWNYYVRKRTTYDSLTTT